MDPASSGGDSRRRKKGRGRKGRNRHPGKGRGNPGTPRHNHKQQGYMPPEHGRDETSILGGRTPRNEGLPPEEQQPEGPPDAFRLFCAYHLGITADDRYHEPRMEEVARRFSMKPEELREALKEHGLDDQTMRASRFDITGAKMDMRLAPEGISRTESARELYEEFQESNNS